MLGTGVGFSTAVIVEESSSQVAVVKQETHSAALVAVDEVAAVDLPYSADG